jgi:hypothetical protein
MDDRQFDDLVRGMATSISRRQAIKMALMAAGAGVLARTGLAGAGVALADNSDCAHFCNGIFPAGPARGECKSDGAHGVGYCPSVCNAPGNCSAGFVNCAGNSNTNCYCFTTTEGVGACGCNSFCSQVSACNTTADCPGGSVCITSNGCTGCGGGGVCVAFCNGANASCSLGSAPLAASVLGGSHRTAISVN